MNQPSATQLEEKTIWILEDDPGCQFIYRQILERKYPISLFSELRSFRWTLESNSEPRPDLLIADMRLPDEMFSDYLRSSSTMPACPFLVVSMVDDVDALRFCFKQGAVDYITKPFRSSELLAKVEKALIYGASLNQDLFIDSVTPTIRTANHRSDALTAKEFQMVSLLAQAPNHEMTRDSMVSQLWAGISVSDKALDVHLFNLRRKMRKIGLDIVCAAPFYKMVVD